MTTQNLLVELLVEELPPKVLKKLGDAFAQSVWAGLADVQLLENSQTSVSGPTYKAFASPRRLAVWIKDVKAQAADKPLEQKLMPVSVGLTPDGQATPALLKKLNALGVDTTDAATVVKQLQRLSDGKAEVLYYNSMAKGASLQQGLQSAIEHALAKLPIPKVMQYQLHQQCEMPGWSTVSFVRPAHGLIALHGNQLVPVTVLGLSAGNSTHGHRFEASQHPVHIAHADAYEETMASQGAVIASFDARSVAMVCALREQAKQLGCRLEVEAAGLTDTQAEEALRHNELVQEVTALVERPTVMVCQFEEEFLQVPMECLTLTMKANQKYFPLLKNDGQLSHRFLMVSNINPANPAAVIGGNERVVRPRLADAKFFFDQDRKKSLESRVAGLDKVIYHNQLGTQGERMLRVCAIAQALAKLLVEAGWTTSLKDTAALITHAVRAARLAKTDLLTDMVGEFPELQGVMGRYYAMNDGEDPLVSEAIADHYRPRFAGDELPRNDVGLVVAMADKLETLVGMFGIGNLPTGDRDPFALRRHALGVTRMLLDKRLAVSVRSLLECAAAVFPAQVSADLDINKLESFFQERLINLLEAEGKPVTHIMAVLAVDTAEGWSQIKSRLDAVAEFANLPQSQALAAANKRISNILKKIDQPISAEVDTSLLIEPAEQQLHQQMQRITPLAHDCLTSRDYTGYLKILAGLRDAVDLFFNDVMVNAEDEKIRQNRWALLKQLQTHMNQVADISRLAQ